MDDALYAALLVYEYSSDAAGHQPLYCETVSLVSATTVDSARVNAEALGKRNETSYANENGETITVSLKHVVDVSEVSDSLGDGADIYSRHFRNYESYRNFEPLLSGDPL